jgi:tRNA (guanine26-N2/guanine27-N2)-dimethyltransferase
MQTRKIKEGEVTVDVPEGRIYDASVFYNPDGEMSRDISISAVQVFQKMFQDKINICDALSGTGIKGLRYAKEIEGINKVFLNDKNPSAVRMIKKNAKDNKLTRRCSVRNEDASLLMRSNVFNVIDLDPFGSPVTFMDSAAWSIYHRGFMCVTATDQSALAGAYPESCLRKYGIKSIKTEFYSELGTRILLSHVILSLARYDKAFMPALSFSSKHYYKIFGRIEHAGKISGLLRDFGCVNYCPICGERKFGKIEKLDSKGHTFLNCGPIYLGKINDKAFCESVLEDMRKRNFKLAKEESRMISMIIEESEMPAFYYDIHFLSKKLRKETPKFEDLIKRLRSKGFKASRTHFCLTAIKSDAEFESLCKNF